jgi:hypothetical protein
MKLRIKVNAIGVGNLEQSLRFYLDGLGLQTHGFVLRVINRRSP